MAVINLLAPHVADMIAAGEVVERPASVVKELMENSVDAGARNIIVEIRGGGATYIRVTDDGCGMSPEDAGVAFLRHATSKLSDEHGLEAIGTMGFRGEALAAISAVSHIELTTRQRGSGEGTFVILRAGDIQDMGSAGCPDGTTMIVKELFFNTPARLKFLKSDRSEASACVSAALRVALGHPEISVRFIRDGSEEFFSPGDNRLDSAVYTLLGREIAKDMLPVESEADGVRVTGFVSSPSACRGNRSAQFFYCNARFIRSALLQSAVEQAYKNTLLTGRYPACVLNLDMSFSSVDVNVHPAKTEVKFSYEKAVFDLVYHSVKFTLEEEQRVKTDLSSPMAVSAPSGSVQRGTLSAAAPSKERASAGAPAAVGRKDDFYRSMSAEDFRSRGYSVPKAAPARPAPVPPSAAAETSTLSARDETVQIAMELPSSVKMPPESDKTDVFPSSGDVLTPLSVENSVQNVGNSAVPDHKILGEVMKTYIAVALDDGLLLIDKHAAHERMIFDRLKKQGQQIMSQTLLSPVPLTLGDADCEVLENNGELLSELGFEIELFGEKSYLIRAVPYDMDASDAAPAVEEILDRLSRHTAVDAASARDDILHTVACKAAIKAGWDTSPQELERVAAAVLSGEVKYCPHGRPVSVLLTGKDMEKMFKRIV